ncbi:GT-D fold domain-containing glycosyltransferase [Sutcliffiella horikoshii]|uniref:GT-D fold domain-containing glycosyltransferase n=1 Tax=Sutcliffiella horikoshii TaxID=79883 RepID=UPI00203F4F5B|nr:GT-D fold domain-containing glycosyltransferase [Sutcliffiella horikoshii]MCM3616820.1 GT-D fold domain-containing glycosyltransferase [Sutcliffiella horikoshii]
MNNYYSKSKALTYHEVLKEIKSSLDRRKPFSLVRIGDGENIVLAQNDVLSMKKILSFSWTKAANKGKKGLNLPNSKLKMELLQSIREASVVGILPYNDKRIKASPRLKRKLTDKIFKFNNIRPDTICDACINRDMAKDKSFWNIIKGKRILLIYKNPEKLKSKLSRKPFNQKIELCLPFSDYTQIERTLKFAVSKKDQFDIALICCGVNSVVLAQRMAQTTGKVCIDFGKGSNVILKDKKNSI